MTLDVLTGKWKAVDAGWLTSCSVSFSHFFKDDFESPDRVLLLLFLPSNSLLSSYLAQREHSQWSSVGGESNSGTWQLRWYTLGHLSQHIRSPPLWHTAHQSSLGSKSYGKVDFVITHLSHLVWIRAFDVQKNCFSLWKSVQRPRPGKKDRTKAAICHLLLGSAQPTTDCPN